jgi:oligopeptidase B
VERALYLELRRRLPQEDATIPECIGSYEYYMRQQPGNNFPVYYRRRREGFPGSREEEVVLDQNKDPMLHQDFHFIVAMKISPDEKTMLLVQENAHEEYRVVLRHFGSGSRFPIKIGSSMPVNKEPLRVLDHLGQVRNVEWCNNHAFYFTSIDEQRRPHAVFRYDLNTHQLDKVRFGSCSPPKKQFSVKLRFCGRNLIRLCESNSPDI